ncbi:MAG: acyl-CoA reductase [Chitinophagaceae bacterium]
MNLQERINLLSRLGEYMLSEAEPWHEAKEKAARESSWFIPEFIELAVKNIAELFLEKGALYTWVNHYKLETAHPRPKVVGIVMAGNIPLVGFHDMLCVFITGHIAHIKASSKDEVLIKHIVSVLASWDDEVNELISFSVMLKGCDAYIATGSNNTAGYFEYYFGKYPNIIRTNRTSVAILSGNETTGELDKLADDVYQYFGLGCRNVTKLYVPAGYDFVPLLSAFKKYNYLADHHKYKNNYDYNLSIHLLNKKYYMSNESLLVVEDAPFFSPISQLNYEFYTDLDKLTASLKEKEELQCIAGHGFTAFGQVQTPSLFDYADGVDTVRFLTNL